MRYREPFTVYPRKMKSGKIIWYYQSYDENGKRTSAFSTGQTSKSAARAYCFKLLMDNALIPDSNGKILFKDYSKDWWIWDKCKFLKYKMTRRSISRNYADTGYSALHKHILPYFKDLRLEEISRYHIEKWLQSILEEGLSTASANNYLNIMNVMLTEAVRRELLKENVCRKIAPLKNTSKTRGILDQAVINTLLNPENCRSLWKNIRCYYANLIAACTGMRMAEIVGLQYTDIGDGVISISKQYMKKYGFVPTKNKETRIIPIPEVIEKGLLDLPRYLGQEFVFCSDRDFKQPLQSSTVLRSLKMALKRMGMSDEEIREKNISFHSWRHYFNTVMRANNITDSKLQKMTGHK